jgi:hypothetical protein
MPAPIITLTTDFGSHGPYVAAMKGIILGIHPDARLVDVSHEIAPQNMREAAFCLTQITACFAAGTIHLVVVDPGVGTDRRLVCVRTQGQLFLAPDNGVLSWVARGRSDVEWWEISAARFWRQPAPLARAAGESGRHRRRADHRRPLRQPDLEHLRERSGIARAGVRRHASALRRMRRHPTGPHLRRLP